MFRVLPQYVALSEKTFYVKGSPATLIHIVNDEAFIVDPGSGSKRRKTLRSILRSLKVSDYSIIVTHYHADHIGIVSKLDASKVYASELDGVFVEHSVLRNYATYGYQISGESKYLLYSAPDTKVTDVLKPPCRIGDDIEILYLPGHTLGQIGVLLPDGVFYIADAAFGDRVLSAVGVPYHFDAILALETIEKLINEQDMYEKIIFSHGPLLDKKDSLNVLELNRKRIADVISKVRKTLGNEPMSVGEITAKILREYGVDQTVTLQMLASVTIRSILAHLSSEGYAEAVVSEKGILWRKK